MLPDMFAFRFQFCPRPNRAGPSCILNAGSSVQMHHIDAPSAGICVLPPSLALVDRISCELIQRPRCRLGLSRGEFVISLRQDFVARNHVWLRILLFTVVFLDHVIHIMILHVCRCCLWCRGCGVSFWADLPHLNQT